MILYGLHRTLALAVDQERDATLAERTSKGWPATDDDVNAFLEAVDRKFFAAAARAVIGGAWHRIYYAALTVIL